VVWATAWAAQNARMRENAREQAPPEANHVIGVRKAKDSVVV
jgi:hypothetical protein